MESVVNKTINILSSIAESRTVADVRIGLGYTCVLLDNGAAGIAWTGASVAGGCSKLMLAGSLAGSSAKNILQLLSDETNELSRSVGLACANALIAATGERSSMQADTKDVLDIISIKPEDYVVMVGFFAPLVPQIKKIGCRFNIVELDASKPSVLSQDEGFTALGECSVALITSTSVVTGTVDGLLASVAKARAAVMLGPSTLMLPAAFANTAVTHLAGAWVRDAKRVLQVVSEGGGTMLLRSAIEFDTITL